MKTDRLLQVVCLLIVFLGGTLGAFAQDPEVRSPFSGTTLQQVQEDKPENTTTSGLSESGQPAISDGKGSGEDVQTTIQNIRQQVLPVIEKTLRSIVDLLRRLLDLMKKLLAGGNDPQVSEPAAGSTPTVVSGTDGQQAPDIAVEQPSVPEVAVPAEPLPEPPAAPEETMTPPTSKRAPTPAECEQLRLLIAGGKVDDAAALLEKGFDIDAKIGDKGTALHYAVAAGQIGIVELLLKRGANLAVRDDNRSAPLHIAAQAKRADICKVLLDGGADVNLTGCDGSDGSDRTPLHLATEMGACDVIKLLIERGANVNALDSLKQTPLSWAIFSGQVEAAGILSEHGGVKDPSKIPAASTTPGSTQTTPTQNP